MLRRFAVGLLAGWESEMQGMCRSRNITTSARNWKPSIVGLRDLTPTTENQMEKNMETEMETRFRVRVLAEVPSIMTQPPQDCPLPTPIKGLVTFALLRP